MQNRPEDDNNEDEEWKSVRDEILNETRRVGSLQEICRDTVRRAVGPRFEHKLSSLSLPTILKSYLMLPELNDLET